MNNNKICVWEWIDKYTKDLIKTESLESLLYLIVSLEMLGVETSKAFLYTLHGLYHHGMDTSSAAEFIFNILEPEENDYIFWEEYNSYPHFDEISVKPPKKKTKHGPHRRQVKSRYMDKRKTKKRDRKNEVEIPEVEIHTVIINEKKYDPIYDSDSDTAPDEREDPDGYMEWMKYNDPDYYTELIIDSWRC